MTSTTKLRRHIGNKTHPTLVETLISARKQKAWHTLAQKLAGPTRQHVSINLDNLDRQAKEGDTIVVAGKILSTGEVTKRFKVCAVSFSHAALEKLKGAKVETVSILEEIKKNPKAEGIKLIA